MLKKVSEVLLVFTFWIILYPGCNAPVSESPENQEMPSTRFPDWLNFDVSNGLSNNILLRDYPDSLTLMLEEYIQQEGGRGKLSPRDSLELMRFKILILNRKDKINTASNLALEALEKAERIRDTQFIVNTLGTYDMLHTVDHFFTPQFEPYIEAGLKYAEQHSNPDWTATLKHWKGYLLSCKQGYPEALHLLKESLNHHYSTDNKTAIAYVSILLGNIFFEIESMDDAIRYYQQAIKYASLARQKSLRYSALNNLGVVYKEQNDLDSALVCYQTILNDPAIIKKANDSIAHLSTVLNTANIYYSKKEYARALKGYEKVQQRCKENNIPHGLALATVAEAMVYAKTNQMNRAISLFDSALVIIKEAQLDFLIDDVLKQYENIYIENGDYEKAYNLAIQNRVIRDSLFNLEKIKAIHELEIKYETEMKEVENHYLLQNLEMKEKELRTRNSLLIFISLLIVGLTYFLLSKNRLNRNLNIAYNALMVRYNAEKNKEKKELERSSKPEKIIEEEEEEKEIMNALHAYFKEKEPFLDAGLRIGDVMNELGINYKQLGNALKTNDYTNFAAFVNEYRVEKAKKILQDEQYAHHTIATIGELAGFGSKQRFYDSFELLTGLKPGYFRDHIK